LTAAAAWRDVEAERGEGEGLWPRNAAASPELDSVLDIAGEPDKDLEGGREFRSGAIEASFYGFMEHGGGVDGYVGKDSEEGRARSEK
jgi:hypothetical protein